MTTHSKARLTNRNSRGKRPVQLTVEEFTIQAIETLRDEKYRGINPIFSGFNNYFKEYFGPETDPVKETTQLAKDGKLVIVPSRAGVTFYKPGEEPEWFKQKFQKKAGTPGASEGLAKILAAGKKK